MSDDIYARAAEVVGEHVIDALTEHGFAIVEIDALDRYQAEHKASDDRLRELAALAMRAAGTTVVRCELVFENGVGRIIVTHPSGDEAEMVRMIARHIAAAHESKPCTRMSTEAEIAAAAIRDPIDVPIAAVKPAEST